MNKIADLLSAANVVVDLDADTKPQLFDAMGRLFERTSGLPAATINASLSAREKLGSTGLGQGIAIPHGRIKGLAQATAAFARLRTPIAFDAPDGRPVSQVFVLLVPEQATEAHLQLLSELAQMFSERTFRDKLAGAAGPAELKQLFADWRPGA